MARSLIVLLGAIVASVTVSAAGDRGRPELDVVVPIDPSGYRGELQWFDGQPHHPLPGTVTINRAPYVCDPHRAGFRDRDRFLAHLQSKHDVLPEEAAAAVVEIGGVMRYPGR